MAWKQLRCVVRVGWQATGMKADFQPKMKPKELAAAHRRRNEEETKNAAAEVEKKKKKKRTRAGVKLRGGWSTLKKGTVQQFKNPLKKYIYIFLSTKPNNSPCILMKPELCLIFFPYPKIETRK